MSENVSMRHLYNKVRELFGVRQVRHRTRSAEQPYIVIGEGEAQCSDWNIQEGDPVVVYLGSDGKLWVRHKNEFESGRFYDVKEGPRW